MSETLLTRFNEIRQDLRSDLQEQSVKDAVAYVEKRMRTLGNEYLAALDAEDTKQHAIAAQLLEGLLQGLEHTLAANHIALWRAWHPKDKASQKESKQWFSFDMPAVRYFAQLRGLDPERTLWQALLFLVTIGLLLTSLGTHFDFFILLGVIGFGALTFISVQPLFAKKIDPVTGQVDHLVNADAKADVLISADLLMSSLTKVCDNFDRTMAVWHDLEGQATLPKNVGDVFDEEMLEFLQSLAQANLRNQAELALAQSSQVRSILFNRGLSLQNYEDGQNKSAFVFEPSLDPSLQKHITVQPAIVKQEDSQVVLLGRVIEPQKKNLEQERGEQ